MAEKEWQAGLSMAERLSATMKIMSACKRSFPDLSSAEVQQKARSLESLAYDEATSSDDYQVQCQDAIDSLHASASTPQHRLPEPESDSLDEAPAQQIGPYKARYHASGVFSTVYKAISPDTGEAIAIKLTTPSVMSPPHNSIREARLLRLAASPHVIPLFSTQFAAGGHFLLIFPFVQYDFSTLLERRAMAPADIRSHLYALFSALSHIHSLGMLHRDVKPSNLLLASPSGPAYLADFGITWCANDSDSEPRKDKITDVGTTCYRAPELLFGYGEYGVGLDLWAAGCVVAEALSGGHSLFDAGELGSELALIRSIFTTLGTPNDRIWPEAKSFPDWGKMQFTEYATKDWSDVLPKLDDDGRSLVAGLVQYESSQRTTAQRVLKHSFFRGDTNIFKSQPL